MNMVDQLVDGFETDQEVTVCAEIVDVTEIEQGFTGNFVITDGTAGKLT